jgi:hypothetical protein
MGNCMSSDYLFVTMQEFYRCCHPQGNIGAASGGLPFLEEAEILPIILEIAEQSLVLSVRGSVRLVSSDRSAS